ncbi:SCF E3 ubiquitin ligase complex F-box protein GRR1 [Pichia kudriavzevii]|uniref:SCF E3 ubiquitin ligase complex F-box protein GRR1 n=1 Tax=Pichia kudriavzevii TaxID=4909 RepID=A0A1V2LEZ8_PICKU|nr:SCF E3 ubiquitin ligase complex F-box protein GRR1 [Pichia kudriavzevii]
MEGDRFHPNTRQALRIPNQGGFIVPPLVSIANRNNQETMENAGDAMELDSSSTITNQIPLNNLGINLAENPNNEPFDSSSSSSLPNQHQVNNNILSNLTSNDNSSNEDVQDTGDNDPETDDEEHARFQLLRKRARTNSIAFPHPNFQTPINSRPGSLIHVLPPETLCLIFSYVYHKKDLLSILLTCKYWASLIRITLVNCTKLKSSSIAKLLDGCSRLQSIDLTGTTHLENDIYYSLANNCKRLQGLYAPGSYNISEDAVLSLIRNCPLLKRVKLSECNNITDVAIDSLVKNCPGLVELDVHGCEKITNASLNNLFLHSECLKEFKISKNQNITYECLENPSGTLLSLERLRILDFTQCSNITDKAVIKFVQLAPKLRNVVLSKCSSITDASLKAIATLGKNLHYIHLGHCSNITDVGAKELLQNCHRLQYIDLACCNQLTNATIIELAKLQKLRRIGLVKCSQITDEGILALAEQARNSDETLERVHLSYCVNLSIFPIYKLLQACPRLTHISLTGISQFLRPDITRFCREPPSEFNPHQKSIFCVFSGEGVNNLRTYLNHLIQTTEVQDREATEILQIIDGIIGTSTPIPLENFLTDENRFRFEHFIRTANDFLGDYPSINVGYERLDLFARCIFGGIQQTQATRVQRFFQLMHSRPVRAREREREAQRLQRMHLAMEATRNRHTTVLTSESRGLAEPVIQTYIPGNQVARLFQHTRSRAPRFHGSALEQMLLAGVDDGNTIVRLRDSNSSTSIEVIVFNPDDYRSLSSEIDNLPSDFITITFDQPRNRPQYIQRNFDQQRSIPVPRQNALRDSFRNVSRRVNVVQPLSNEDDHSTEDPIMNDD